MTDETMPSGLWQETRRAAETWKQARGPRGDQPAEPGPEPVPIVAGQVLILQELGEPRLAWTVLRREAGESARLLLLATDVNPLVGSGDVATAGPAAGSLTVRCRFAVWASERELGATTLLGTLPPEALSLTDSRWQAIAAGRPVGSFSEHETEEDPEYQDWIEDVVRPAAGKLEARAGARAGISAPIPSPALPFPARRSAEPPPSPRGAWMRWAAVLAFVGLGIASGVLWWRQAREITGLRAAVEASEASHRRAIAELEGRRAALEAQYQARLQKAGEDRARLEAEHRAQLQELEEQLEQLRQATVIKNPQIAILDPAATQRGMSRIKIDPEVSHLVLLLPVADPEGTEFQVEIDEEPLGKQVLVQKGLQLDVHDEVRLGLPVVLVPPGDYRLRLFRKEGEKLHLVHQHMITIEEAPKRRRPRW